MSTNVHVWDPSLRYAVGEMMVVDWSVYTASRQHVPVSAGSFSFVFSRLRVGVGGGQGARVCRVPTDVHPPSAAAV